MPHSFLYCPILRTKAGEAAALEYLVPWQRDRIFPIFRVTQRPPATFAAKLAAGWVGRRAALDGMFSFRSGGATADFDAVFQAMSAVGVLVIPSTIINAPATYLASVRAKIGQNAPGLVLRCRLNELANAVAYATSQGWSPSDVDLVVLIGSILEHDPAALAGPVAALISTHVSPGTWRSVAFGSSAAPKDFGSLNHGLNIVPRLDWQLWQGLPQNPAMPIHYSDFGTTHLDMTEPPSAAMASATVSVRYTTNADWLMIKGVRTNGPTGIAMPIQYQQHAITLASHPAFNHVVPCWADGKITAIASSLRGTGSRTTWVEIAMNRHFSVVTHQLP